MTGLKCQEGAVDTVFVQKGAIRTPSIASLEVTHTLGLYVQMYTLE